MKIHCIFSVLLLIPLLAFGQYPNNPNKMRLGFQTTGDGLIFRGVVADTAIKPIGLFNAYFLLDTVGARLYRYIRTRGRWQLAGTDSQTLSFTSPTLSISGGNSVNLSGLLSGYPSGTGTTNTLPIWTSSTTLGNSIVTESSGELVIGGTGSARLPNGTTAQRPTHGGGKFRWNTTNGAPDISDGTNWRRLTMQTDAAFGANHIPFANSAGVLESSSLLSYSASTGIQITGAAATGTRRMLNFVTSQTDNPGRNFLFDQIQDPFNTGATAYNFGTSGNTRFFINNLNLIPSGSTRFDIQSGGNLQVNSTGGQIFFVHNAQGFLAGDNGTTITNQGFQFSQNGLTLGNTVLFRHVASIDNFLNAFDFTTSRAGNDGGTFFGLSNIARNAMHFAVRNNGQIAIGANTTTTNHILTINSTNAIRLPSGTTAQRPTAAPGSFRFNSTLNAPEIGYNAGSFGAIGIYGGSGNLQANNTDVRYDASGTSKMRFGNFTAAKEWYLDLVSDGSFNNALQISANSSNFGGGFQTANFAMTSGIYSGRNITTQFSTALTQATGTKSGEFSYSLGYHSNRTGGGHFLKYDSAAVQGGSFLSYSFDSNQADTNGDKLQVSGLFRGTVSGGNYDRIRASTPSFLVQTVTRGVSASSFFDWLRIDNLDTDTTSNRVWLYGKYAMPNAAPRTASDARSVVEWAGTGSAATPSFVASGVFTESSVRTASFTIDSVKLLGVEEYRAWCEIPSVGGSLLDIQFPKPGAIWERKQIVIVAEDENATFSIDAFCTSGNHFYYWNAGAMTAQASYSITAASTDYTGPGATVIFRCINRGGTYYWVPGLTGK